MSDVKVGAAENFLNHYDPECNQYEDSLPAQIFLLCAIVIASSVSLVGMIFILREARRAKQLVGDSDVMDPDEEAAILREMMRKPSSMDFDTITRLRSLEREISDQSSEGCDDHDGDEGRPLQGPRVAQVLPRKRHPRAQARRVAT